MMHPSPTTPLCGYCGKPVLMQPVWHGGNVYHHECTRGPGAPLTYLPIPPAPVGNDFKLIKITDALIVHPQEIVKARRDGNYTDVWLRGDSIPHQVCDEDERLWQAIQNHVA